MSGIEVAGLVLGALPLLLSGLEYYKEGMIPLKDFVRFEMVIRELRRRLQNAHMRFKNTCEKLLNGLLSQDDESLLLLLLRNPGGPEWQTPEMMQKIRLRLQKSYETFLDTVVYIGFQLDELRTVIGLDDKGYVSLEVFPPSSASHWKSRGSAAGISCSFSTKRKRLIVDHPAFLDKFKGLETPPALAAKWR